MIPKPEVNKTVPVVEPKKEETVNKTIPEHEVKPVVTPKPEVNKTAPIVEPTKENATTQPEIKPNETHKVEPK